MREVEFQLITVTVRIAKKTTIISGIVICSIDICPVTATHDLFIDNSLFIEGDFSQTIGQHTTHVSATIERTELAGIRNIILDVIEHHTGQQFHGTALHVLVEDIELCQIHRVEFRTTSNRRIGKGTQHTFCLNQTIFVTHFLIVLHHVRAIVAKEQTVDGDIRADLHMGLTVRDFCQFIQRGTVTTHKDRTFDKDWLFFGTSEEEGHLLSIGTYFVEGLRRLQAGDSGIVAQPQDFLRIIIEVTPEEFVLQRRVVGIGIRTITTAIDTTMDSGQDSHGVTTIDITGDIVTAIDIIDVTAEDSRSRCEACRDASGILILSQLDILIRHILAILIQRAHIGLSATTIDIVNSKCRGFRDDQQQTLRTGHTTFVTTAIEVSHLTTQQVPPGLNGHVDLVVTSEEITDLESTTVRIGELVVDAHLDETGFGQQVSTAFILFAVLHFNVVHHLTWIIQMDDSILGHRSHVATAKDVDNRTAQEFKISSLQIRLMNVIFSPKDLSARFSVFKNMIQDTFNSLRTVSVVTIAAAEELSDIGLLRSIDRFSVSLHLGRNTDEGVPIFGNFIIFRFLQLCR